MEISKFKLQDTLLGLKDETARQTIGDVQVIAERAEGKADDVQTVADRAEGKADEAQAVADRAEGKADEALADILLKQNILNHPSYTGDINTLVNNPEYNGYYFVNGSIASGTQPSTSFYMLLVFGGLQLAVTASSTTVYLYARTYVNSTWSYWRKVQLTN